MIDGGARLMQKILCYLVCLLAMVGLIIIWSATPTGFDVYETLRLLVLAAGLALVTWNLVAVVADPAPEAFRYRLIVFGIVIAIGGALAPHLLPAGPLGEWKITGPSKPSPRPVAILAINDVYRIEGLTAQNRGGLARLRTLRRQLEDSHDVLVLHAGDLIFPSYLSSFFQGRQMIDILNLLDGRDAVGVRDKNLYVTFGNHEFDASDCARPQILRERVAESDFYWLTANIQFDRCARGGMTMTSRNVVESRTVIVGDIKIGLFGLTLDLGSDRPYPPIGDKAERRRIAARLSKDLRAQGAELVVAVTHLPYEEDQQLLARQSSGAEADASHDGPDLIIGGHDHERMAYSVDGRWLFKADSDAVTASVVLVERDQAGKVGVSQRFVHVDDTIEEDPLVKQRVSHWVRKQDAIACTGLALPPGCLDHVLTVAGAVLEGEENKIRSRQTSLGTWVTNVMLSVYAPTGAEDSASRCTTMPRIAFINSGTLRLNTDIPRGGNITLRNIEELLAFPTELQVVSVSANTLMRVMENSSKQRGSGGWLQTSGIRVGTGTAISVRSPDGGEGWTDLASVSDRDAKIFPVVTSAWLLHRGGSHDGYDIDASAPLCLPVDLKKLLVGGQLQPVGEKKSERE